MYAYSVLSHVHKKALHCACVSMNVFARGEYVMLSHAHKKALNVTVLIRYCLLFRASSTLLQASTSKHTYICIHIHAYIHTRVQIRQSSLSRIHEYLRDHLVLTELPPIEDEESAYQDLDEPAVTRDSVLAHEDKVIMCR